MLGRDPWKDAVELHRRVAYVPGDVTLWRNLSGGEVIDLYGRADQPLANKDGTVWVSFNGGLYNFPALRAELGKALGRARDR